MSGIVRKCIGAGVVILLLATVAVIGTKLQWWPWTHDGQTVSQQGGSVRSADGNVSVTFAPQQLTGDTRVVIDPKPAVPPPVPGFEPLMRAFDIRLDRPSRGGTVTAHYELPAGASVDSRLLAMFILDGGAWKLVPTTVDPAKQTITGRWPHFTPGYVGWFNPLDKAGDILNYSWDTAKAGAGLAKDVVARTGKTVVDGVVSGVVAANGGTTDTAKCQPNDTYWTVSNSLGMTGCTGPQDGNGLWPVRVNDRYPYPMLVKLPRGVIAPGWKDLLDSYDFADLIIAMGLSLGDRMVIPAGKTVPLKFLPNAPDELKLHGTIDPFTLAVKALEVLAVIVSDGMTAESIAAAKAEIVAAETELWEAHVAALKAGKNDGGLAAFIEKTQGDNSLLELRRRALTKNQAGVQVGRVFDLIDLGQCAFGVAGVVKDKTKSFGEQAKDSFKLLFDRCFPQFLDKLIDGAYAAQKQLLDPKEQAKRATELSKALLGEVKNLQTLSASKLALQLSGATAGKLDLTTANVTARRPGVDVLTAVVNQLAPGNTVLSQTDNSMTVRTQDGTLTPKVECEGPRLVRPGTVAVCTITSPLAQFDPGFAAARVLPGNPPTAEILIMDGDYAQACTQPWALQAALKAGYHPNCE